MPNSYTQIYIQFVFAVKYRKAVIDLDWEQSLYKYITAIVQDNHHKVLAINGMPDHLHLFIGYHTTQSIADLMRLVKANSSKWINDNNLTQARFEWQTGYGAFSYSKSSVKNVINYIHRQKHHHTYKKFREEYREFLEKYEIAYQPEYCFQELI